MCVLYLSAPQATIATITSIQRQKGVTETSLLNYIMSDGNCMIATRFVSPETADAASLYYAEGG
jgi:glutamine amidotransferase